MMPLHWLLRMRRWVENPPSMRRVIFYGAIIGVCIAVATFEWLYGWPEALTISRPPRLPR